MKKRFFKLLCVFLALLLSVMWIPATAQEQESEDKTSPEIKTEPVLSDLGVEDGFLNLNCKSAILMEATTGTVLYCQNAEEAMPPASVTKIITLLLLMEAIDSGIIHLEDQVTVSANAASMGGSQVYLKEGERMMLEDLLKSVVIASANDAAVALAEYLYGSVSAFVSKMNERAAQLGMKDTSFENVTGLDDTAEHHLTSAKDIAIMSRELIAHPTILQYSSIWMDTIRDGAFGLTNTNRLVRFYPGCTGLKTGSTSKAGFCVSVTAVRNGFSLICVIMGAESRDIRNAAAVSLLDWGFANYDLFTSAGEELGTVRVSGGEEENCPVSRPAFSCVLPKADLSRVEKQVQLPEKITAPVTAGSPVGEVLFRIGEKEIGKVPAVATETVKKLTFFEILRRTIASFFLI